MQPHIIFPRQEITTATSSKKSFPNLVTPPINKKARWITEKLDDLFESGTLSTEPTFWPERTLVFEIIGSVEEFYTALKNEQGYKFLLSEIGDEIEPDEYYYYKGKQENERQDKKLPTNLYFSMVNRDSLETIYSCWENYKNNNNYKFPKGSAALKKIFNQLRSIRFWDTEDRLNVTGLYEDFLERIKHNQEIIPVEIELWFHTQSTARQRLETKVTEALQKLDARIVKRCEIQAIGYHALLVHIPTIHIKKIIEKKYEEIDLVRCDSIMFFRPVGQCGVTPLKNDTEYELPSEQNSDIESTQYPVVALFDGYPLTNHQSLSDRLIVEDFFDLADSYRMGEQRHGTSMSSLILHGDKKNNELPLARKIVLCPIMAPDENDSFNSVREEKVAEDQLPIDLTHICVKRLLEGTKEHPPIAPHVKIINISIGDHHRLFDRRMSPWAKLLDWLSYTYNVLFVVSAGNHGQSISLDVTTTEFEKLSETEKEQLFLNALQKDSGIKRLRSPAEAINVLTVGALHEDNCDDREILGPQINPFISNGMPSPLNPISWGKKRSVKPEVLTPGGRQTYRNTNKYFDNKNVILEPLISDKPPGLLSAAPGSIQGKTNSYVYTSGTSNATALATRNLAQLYETLTDLHYAPRGDELEKKAEAVLLKALLCHGAQPSDAFKIVEDSIRQNPIERRFKANIARFFGYGAVSRSRLFGCEDYQATLLRSGFIKNNQQHRFKLPLPPSLASKTVQKRLIVTLAWFSPITSQRNYYREAKCWFSIVNNSYSSILGLNQKAYDESMIKNGTLQHEIFFGELAGVFDANGILEVDVFCKIKDTQLHNHSIAYGLVVTMDTTDTSIPIYKEIKEKIESSYKQSGIINVKDKSV